MCRWIALSRQKRHRQNPPKKASCSFLFTLCIIIVASSASEANSSTFGKDEAEKGKNDLMEIQASTSHYSIYSHPKTTQIVTQEQPRLRSMFDMSSYRGYLRRAYGIMPNDAVEDAKEVNQEPSRRFFFGGYPLDGLFGVGGDYEEKKERCQFYPYQQYGGIGTIGGAGAFPYGTSYQGGYGGGHHYPPQHDHDEQEEYGLQHDYLLSRKKRHVINRRQGFLADDGYTGGGHYDDGGGEHYGGYHHQNGHYKHREKVHPLGYYYCKKGHCGIDGYCTKKTPDYQRRPVQSLHYHRRPHYTRHHFYDNQGGDTYHHHHGDYHHVGDYSPEHHYVKS